MERLRWTYPEVPEPRGVVRPTFEDMVSGSVVVKEAVDVYAHHRLSGCSRKMDMKRRKLSAFASM